MIRIAGVAVAVVAGALAGGRVAGTGELMVPREPSMSTPTPAFDDSDPLGALLPDDERTEPTAASVAERWVAAMWSRLPGETPFDWLDRVADITSAELDARLRSARPWSGDADVVSATVDVTGVHAHAHDPYTLTVGCVVHRRTASGTDDLPCVTTVTVAPLDDGRLAVVAVR